MINNAALKAIKVLLECRYQQYVFSRDDRYNYCDIVRKRGGRRIDNRFP